MIFLGGNKEGEEKVHLDTRYSSLIWFFVYIRIWHFRMDWWLELGFFFF
jgi:hypothetical protein